MENLKKNNTIVQHKGVGVLSLLGILFVGLKLGSVINWSWWLVLLPFYGPFLLALIVMAFLSMVIGGISLAQELSHRKKRNK